MKKLLTLLLALFTIGGAMAEDVTEDQALELAQNFLNNQQTAAGRPRKAQGMQKQLALQGKVSGLYVFSVKNDKGFVIVSNDDRTYPILGFSETDDIDINNIPDNMKAWLQGYADEIAWAQQHNGTVTPPKTEKVGTHSTIPVAPLCKSTWDQDAPYYNLCPTYNHGLTSGRCATGCVATAMAQVMYYHKWPQAATKPVPGYITYTLGLNLDALPSVVFDWNNMKDSYSGNYTAAQGNAVATLMKYCGWGVKMDYDNSSGAYTEDVATALVNYFDYNPYTTRFVARSSYSYANWTDLIYHEVANKRPVCYGGMSNGGGHEFVCDGYKFESNTDFFHINWGWSGLSDNYFVLSALDPDQQGIGGSTSTDGFWYGQDAVIGIQKSTSSDAIADIDPNDNNLVLNSITLSETAVEPYTSVTITFNVTNAGNDPYDGDIWLSLREEGTDYLLDAELVNIPAGATQNVVISYLPIFTGSFEFSCSFVNSNGEYITFDTPTATLVCAQNLTNDVVPIDGIWTDNFSRSQFIIAEANLEDYVNTTLTGVTFYATQDYVSWGRAEFNVYLSETSDKTINALKDWDTLEKVYSGSLSVSDGKMTINFDDRFYYQGGNLLVGVNQTEMGTYADVSWKGENVTGASVGGHNTTISQQNFRPNTVFTYVPGNVTPLKAPLDLAVSYTGGTYATVSWTSYAPSFDIEVNGTVYEDVSNPFTLEGLELATIYIIKVRARDGEDVSDWTEPVSFTTSLSEETCQVRLELSDMFGDGWSGAAIKIVDVLTGTELGTFTNTDEAGKNEAQIYYAEVPDDRDIEFQWVKGSYDGECSYAVYDVRDNLIFSGSRRLTENVAYHVQCTEPVVTGLVLANNSDNTAAVEDLDGTANCKVTLAGRTFFRDNTWNTICLPFDVTIADSPLAGADVRTLSSITRAGETVILNFTNEGSVTSLTAGTPYIIKWANADNLFEPVFNGVTIDKTLRDATFTLDEGLSITFRGTYGYTAFTEADRSILFVGAGNKLNYPLAGATIGAQRAYFKLTGISASDKSAIKQFVLNFDDDPTGLQIVNSESSNSKWYDLNGRKLAGKPIQKGVYIRDGEKVTIK